MAHSVDDGSMTLSYLALRRLIGVVAILHPIILFVGGALLFDLPLQPSMSDYYWTEMRDVFVGIDIATGVFLLCYVGHDNHDRVIAAFAGIASIMVALFPTPPLHVAELSEAQSLAGLVHAIAAISFLVAIAYFCLVLFVKSKPGQEMTPGKRRRNHFYKACGWVIVSVIALLCVYVAVPSIHLALSEIPFVFAMEVVAFWTFGAAWLVKGHFLRRSPSTALLT